MSKNYEWIGVEDATIEIVPSGFNLDDWETCRVCDGTGLITFEDGSKEYCGEYHNAERTTEGPAVIIGALVVQAEEAGQLVEFARTLLRMAESFETQIITEAEGVILPQVTKGQ